MLAPATLNASDPSRPTEPDRPSPLPSPGPAVTIFRCPDFRPRRALLHALPPGDVELLAGEPVPAGSVLVVRLDRRAPLGQGAAMVRVTGVSRQADGRWLVRCSRACSLGRKELHKALQAA